MAIHLENATCFECPDFFELSVDNQAAQKNWVLTAADSVYGIGKFDGTRFESEQSRLTGHQGKGFYAAQTFSDIAAQDGRRIQIGWFQTETPGMPFNQSMTIPLELKLITTADGPRMTFTPVKELTTLRTKHRHFDEVSLKPGESLEEKDCELVELRAELEPGAASVTTFSVRGVAIEYLAKTQQLRIGDRLASAPLRDGKFQLTVYCDRTGLEIFASDGLCYVPWPVNLEANNRRITMDAQGDSIRVKNLDIYHLRSIWP